MKNIIFFAALLLAPFAARAQDAFPTANGHRVPGEVPLACTLDANGNITSCAPAMSASVASPRTAFTSNTISAANAYQQVAPTCPHGGSISDTSSSGTAQIYVDWTTGITAASALGNGSIPIGSTATTGQPGGYLVIPPTASPVWVYGPAGATYHGSCG